VVAWLIGSVIGSPRLADDVEGLRHRLNARLA